MKNKIVDAILEKILNRLNQEKEVDLTKYKKTLSKNKISCRMVAIYTGHTRETISLWLNGKKPPRITAIHIEREILELLNPVITLNKEND